jgi:hypothetical protein
MIRSLRHFRGEAEARRENVFQSLALLAQFAMLIS